VGAGARLGVKPHPHRAALASALDRLRGVSDLKIIGHIYDESLSHDERLGAIKASLDGHRDMVLRCVSHAMKDLADGDPGADATPGDGEMMSLVQSAAKGLHAGLRLADHSESVLAAVEEFVARVESYAALKAAEGRSVPAARRGQFAQLRARLDAVLKATEPRVSAREAEQLHIQFLALQARLHGGV
jgi:hypothetical protein